MQVFKTIRKLLTFVIVWLLGCTHDYKSKKWYQGRTLCLPEKSTGYQGKRFWWCRGDNQMLWDSGCFLDRCKDDQAQGKSGDYQWEMICLVESSWNKTSTYQHTLQKDRTQPSTVERPCVTWLSCDQSIIGIQRVICGFGCMISYD